MQQYRLKCPCGYESNNAPFGADAWSSDYYVPVVVNDDEVLRYIRVTKREDESDEQFDDRLDPAIASKVVDTYGKNTSTMTPLGIKGEQFVKCPKCKNEQAKFEFAGF